MKRSLKSVYHIMLSILVALILLELLLLLIMTSNARELAPLVNDVQTTVIIFALVIFIYAIVIYNIIPLRIKRSLEEVEKTVKEISQGNYDIEIDLEQYKWDRDIQQLMLGLKTLLRSIQGFDQAKEAKIYEHDQRIKQLINLLPQGALILLTNGDVSYCNDTLRRKYPTLNEVKNIHEINLKDDLAKKIFARISDALRLGDNIYDAKIPDQEYQQQAVINGSVVRNTKGDATGGVFTLHFSKNVKKED
jgi:signal transduction histidine kinase